MTLRDTPPFRADHVGSLLRPAQLLQARRAAGRRRDRRRRAARRRGRGDPRRRRGCSATSGLQLGDRRRVPPDLLAHGLHLPARRGRRRPTEDPGAHAQRGRRGRVHRRRRCRSTPRSGCTRPSSATTSRSWPVHVDPASRQADDPVAVDGALPRRPGGDRPGGLPGRGAVLGRPVAPRTPPRSRPVAELGCRYLQLDDTSLAYLNDPRAARPS